MTGFIGLIGAGRSETAKALIGIGFGRSGEVLLDGKPIRVKHPSDAVALGIGMVPEDRQAEGVILDSSIARQHCSPSAVAAVSAGV